MQTVKAFLLGAFVAVGLAFVGVGLFYVFWAMKDPSGYFAGGLGILAVSYIIIKVDEFVDRGKKICENCACKLPDKR